MFQADIFILASRNILPIDFQNLLKHSNQYVSISGSSGLSSKFSNPEKRILESSC